MVSVNCGLIGSLLQNNEFHHHCNSNWSCNGDEIHCFVLQVQCFRLSQATFLGFYQRCSKMKNIHVMQLKFCTQVGMSLLIMYAKFETQSSTAPLIIRRNTNCLKSRFLQLQNRLAHYKSCVQD